MSGMDTTWKNGPRAPFLMTKSALPQTGLLPQVDNGAALPVLQRRCRRGWRFHSAKTVMRGTGAIRPRFAARLAACDSALQGGQSQLDPFGVLGSACSRVPELGRDDGVILHIDEERARLAARRARCPSSIRRKDPRLAVVVAVVVTKIVVQGSPETQRRFVLLARLLGASGLAGSWGWRHRCCRPAWRRRGGHRGGTGSAGR